jgi:chitinase
MPCLRRRTLVFAFGPALALAAFLVASIACEVAQVPVGPVKPNKVVLGYYRTVNKAAYPASAIDFAYLTHIAHAFAWPDSSGNLVVPAGFLYPELNAAAHAGGVKMIVSLGGWGNAAGFPGTASTAENRSRFAAQLVDFCRANAYDGADLDWEFVSNETEKADFSLLVETLSSAFRAQSPQLLLTIAAPSGNYYGRWIDFERLAGAFDLIGVMTYDYHGDWSDHSGHNSPLYEPAWDSCGSLDESFAYARSRQVPLDKLLVGVPFFGRSFDCGAMGAPFTTSQGWSYTDVMALPSSGWTRVWDNEAQVPYLRRTDGGLIISYDDMSSAGLKAQYVKDKGSAGVIIWELGGDYRSGNAELLEVLGKSFGARSARD